MTNQPVSMTGSGVNAAYTYDGNKKRVKSAVGGKTTYYVYSAVTGGLIYKDAVTDGKTTEYAAIGPAGVRLENGTTPVYTHADHLGSAVAATDAAGAILWRENYLPFGEKLLNPAGNADNTGFTGHVEDAATGLTYMQARYYDPVIGRFLSTDPIDYRDQLNLYAYVANDPVNATDPTGEFALGLASKVIKVAIKGGDLGATFAGAAADAGTLFSANATGAERALAAASLASEIASPVSLRDAKAGVNAAQAALKKTCCFVAGTLVETEDGLRPIEEIEIGDKVWARDEETGETALKAVTDLIRRHERVIWEVVLAGPEGEAERFETTDDHPWWIAGQGWKTTEELAAGMAVVTRGGRGMVVASVVETDRTDATYNLTVADFETYFVGEQRVLVHNCKINAQKQAGHVPGTPQNENRIKQGKPTSTFTDAQTADALTKDTVNTGTPVPGRPGVKEKEFGGHVGTGPNGGTQTKVRTHTDSNGVSHGHPQGASLRTTINGEN